MKIQEIMTKEVVYAEVPGRSSEALELILRKNISGLPVVKKGTREVMGVVTRDDFARHPEEGQLALLMTKEITTISPEADILEAARILENRAFRRLPVVQNGELVGILSVSDIVRKAIAGMEIEEPIENYMEEKISAIWEGTPIKVAFELMRLSESRALPVLDSQGKLVGVIADTDLLQVTHMTESTEKSEISLGTEGDRWGWDSKDIIYITKKRLELPDQVVGEVMVRNVVSATKKTSVSECARKMAKSGVEQIPVIDAEGELIGIVRDVALLEALRK
jgi:CBS domain-containing protein